MHENMFIKIYRDVFIYIYIYIYVYMCMYIYIHIWLPHSLFRCPFLSASHPFSFSLSLSLSISLSLSHTHTIIPHPTFSRVTSEPIKHPKPGPGLGWIWPRRCTPSNPFFFTLGTGPRRSLSLHLSDTRVYEPQIPLQVAPFPLESAWQTSSTNSTPANNLTVFNLACKGVNFTFQGEICIYNITLSQNDDVLSILSWRPCSDTAYGTIYCTVLLRHSLDGGAHTWQPYWQW